MKLRLLSGADIRALLPMADAVQAMKDAFAALSAGAASAPPRQALSVEEPPGTCLVMGSAVPGEGLATKVVSVFPGNTAHGLPVVNGLVVVLDPGTGRPEALCDGTALTAWRTGAASGAATDLLARSDATTALMIGCGAQAETQVLAIDAVRDLSEIWVAGRRPARVAAFVDALQPSVRARLVVADSVDDALARAEIVCTATNAATPVMDGRRLQAGAHVNGVGSFTLDMCEVDPETIRRARIFVDAPEAALAEAGELVAAQRAGITAPSAWTELGDVARGAAEGRRNRDEITFFKSVGHAVQDVVASSRVVAAARAQGRGRDVEL